jgi:hypothetical protein
MWAKDIVIGKNYRTKAGDHVVEVSEVKDDHWRGVYVGRFFPDKETSLQPGQPMSGFTVNLIEEV